MLVGIEVKHRYLDVIASFFKADVYITWSSNWLDLRLDSYHIWTPSKSYLQELGDFWKLLVTNYLLKVSQMFGDFWDIL